MCTSVILYSTLYHTSNTSSISEKNPNYTLLCVNFIPKRQTQWKNLQENCNDFSKKKLNMALPVMMMLQSLNHVTPAHSMLWRLLLASRLCRTLPDFVVDFFANFFIVLQFVKNVSHKCYVGRLEPYRDVWPWVLSQSCWHTLTSLYHTFPFFSGFFSHYKNCFLMPYTLMWRLRPHQDVSPCFCLSLALMLSCLPAPQIHTLRI